MEGTTGLEPVIRVDDPTLADLQSAALAARRTCPCVEVNGAPGEN